MKYDYFDDIRKGRIVYPINLEDGMAYLVLPEHITYTDAERISKMVKSIVIEPVQIKEGEL